MEQTPNIYCWTILLIWFDLLNLINCFWGFPQTKRGLVMLHMLQLTFINVTLPFALLSSNLQWNTIFLSFFKRYLIVVTINRQAALAKLLVKKKIRVHVFLWYEYANLWVPWPFHVYLSLFTHVLPMYLIFCIYNRRIHN